MNQILFELLDRLSPLPEGPAPAIPIRMSLTNGRTVNTKQEAIKGAFDDKRNREPGRALDGLATPWKG